ncbi:MAG: hypothetical protein ABW184_13740 [Sphingobium sp.]
MRRDSRGKRPSFYDNAGLDQMMSMIMVLASEMSVLTDHIDSLERVIAANGIDVSAGMAGLTLDQDALEQRETRRQQLLGRLFYLMRKEAAESGAGETAPGYMAVIDEIALP